MTSPRLEDLVSRLDTAPGRRISVAVREGVGLGLCVGDLTVALPSTDPFDELAAIEASHRPRWVWWSSRTARALARHGVVVDRCWDVVAVHRLVEGGLHWTIASVWASLHDLDPDRLPELGQLDLLTTRLGEEGRPDNPIQPDGYLRPEWTTTGWSETPDRLATWARLAAQAAAKQDGLLAALPEHERVRSTAHAESAAALLCAEMEVGGLPFDEVTALEIVHNVVGPPTRTWREEDAQREFRDREVLRHVDHSQPVNLRNADEVKSLLRRIDIDLPDTRAWRLEHHRESHPVVEALLHWRKSERIATTYGYRWLEEHVADGRLRGSWASSDGSAGRMTASAGLHNLPAEMRPAVCADPGHVFVRADLGQIEPRVLAAVSGDERFVAATQSNDLYAEVAQHLGVPRQNAKLAVLGAMYGATTGESAHALRRLERTYPTAMAMLDDAALHGQEKRDLRTSGGRRIRLSGDHADSSGIEAARAAAASRGRYARNALIQGAAAEFFKVWAIIVRRRSRALGAQISLCLHDELLVHCPSSRSTEAIEMMMSSIDEAAYYWSPSPSVRFVADVSVVTRWSEVKG